jgi:hypothetical protein
MMTEPPSFWAFRQATTQIQNYLDRVDQKTSHVPWPLVIVRTLAMDLNFYALLIPEIFPAYS